MTKCKEILAALGLADIAPQDIARFDLGLLDFAPAFPHTAASVRASGPRGT